MRESSTYQAILDEGRTEGFEEGRAAGKAAGRMVGQGLIESCAAVPTTSGF
jgi:predicted transposase YdaD